MQNSKHLHVNEMYDAYNGLYNSVKPIMCIL